ncbi:MAG: bacterioferritin-associated ferredoxin [Hydrogenophaga sp.]
MIVCVCHRISDRTIARAAQSGMPFDDVQRAYGVATQCGKCETCARAVWAAGSPAQPVSVATVTGATVGLLPA